MVEEAKNVCRHVMSSMQASCYTVIPVHGMSSAVVLQSTALRLLTCEGTGGMPSCCRVANVIVRDADYDHAIDVLAQCCAVMGVDIARTLETVDARRIPTTNVVGWNVLTYCCDQSIGVTNCSCVRSGSADPC